MTKADIIEAWAWIRQNNHSIPDDVLDFMKDAAIEKLESSKVCSCCHKNEPSICGDCVSSIVQDVTWDR